MTAAPLLAHGLGGRTDLPLPTWMVGYGGGLVLLVSFLALAVLWRRSRWEAAPPSRLLLADSAALRVAFVLARIVGFAAFALVLAAALVGEDSATFNLAPTAVYIAWWVGVPIAGVLVGDVWHALNPMATIAAAVDAVARRGRPSPQPPAWTRWAAAAGLLGFVWLELVHPDPSRPRVVATAMVAYVGWVVVASVLWGRGWVERGESFTVLFRLIGRIGPLGADGRGGLVARPPLTGLAGIGPRDDVVWVVLVLLGSTSFDGLTRTSTWTQLADRVTGPASTLLGTVGLLWAIALVAVVYLGAMRATARTTDAAGGTGSLARTFANSLVPIAFAYGVAHYFSLLVLEGQAVIRLSSDPFGWGWDLFGTADHRTNFTLLAATAIAWVQVAAIVLGHVAGVVLAHDRALAVFPAEDEVRAQYPLLVAMILFTVGGLFLLLGG